MSDSIRVELPIFPNSKVIGFKTMGELRKKYNKLEIVKYIYIDPADGKLKGFNPHDEIPIVANSNISVFGELRDIIEFSKDTNSSNE